MFYNYFEQKRRKMNMRNKKEVSISLGSIIVILLIVILVGLLIYAYKTIQEIKTNELKTVETNETPQKDGEPIELKLDDSQVKNIIEKINFPTYAIASIYRTEGFDINTIKNDLILRLAWSKATKELVENTVNEIGEYKRTATQEEMGKCIKRIFGENIEYTNETFNNIEVQTFHGYEESQGEVNYNNEIYTANYLEGGGGDVPFIHQQIEKALKYDSKIEIYVKTAFIDAKYVETANEYDYIIYKEFKQNEFNDKVAEIDDLTFMEAYTEKIKELSDLKNNTQIEKISSELNTYVYIFKLDEDGQYYLTEFNKVK